MARKPAKKRVKRAKKATLFQRVRGNFFTGLVVVAPVALTIYVVWSFIGFIDAKVVPLVPAAYNPATYLGKNIAGFGVVIFFVFTAFVGALTKGLFGRQLLKFAESLVDRTPVVRSIYNALKQIVETILSKSGTTFKHACLIEYPRKGIWAIAFVSTETKGEIPGKIGEGDMLSVFVPTTPNPTSGFLLFFPRKDVILLDMDVEAAAKLAISAGLVMPPTPEEIAAGRRPAPKRNGAPRPVNE